MGSAFEHLQSIVSSRSSTKSTSNCSIQTKTDAKFDATTHLLLTASRLSSAANVLDEYVKVISSDESISKSLAPIPSVNYVHRRMEAKRKSEVVDVSSNSRISPDLQLVCDYVAHEDRKKKGDTHEITPPKKKLRVASRHDRRKSFDDIILPLPANGHEYRKPEVAMILSAYTKGTKEMASTMNKMINLKYVPCGIHKLRRLVTSATNGEQPVLITDWIATGGRPSYCQ